ncbi:ATP-binding protein [Algoriphagus aquimarinus]|uniref:ATP-binding protein n=1 Tax=Algoriphagus aquimarinus TaxID=237018 RepID=UPI0030DD0A51
MIETKLQKIILHVRDLSLRYDHCRWNQRGHLFKKADGSAIKEMLKLEKLDVLILDDFGIQPLDVQSRMLLMEIIEDRHGKKSTIITSKLPISAWYEIIGDHTLADAILDRIVHDAHRIELQGESLRRKRKINPENQ